MYRRLKAGRSIAVICSSGQCDAKWSPISHGLTMTLDRKADGTSNAAMAAQVKPKLAETVVFLSALIMP